MNGSVNPDGNRLTESISEPTEEEIQTLLDNVAPKLRRVLRTQQSAYRFVELLVSSLFEGIDRKVTPEGLVIVNPAQQPALVDPEPAESPVEPASSTPDALVELSAESIRTPTVL